MALAAMLRPATADRDDPIFMNIRGIPGESTDDAHLKWIDLTGYSSKITKSGGAGVGRTALDSFVVTMPYSLAVPPLLRALATGATLGTVELQAEEQISDTPQELNYLTITLSNARVTEMDESSMGDRPTETVTFAAARYNVSYTALNPDGTTGATSTFCFNFALQRAC
jgi:type VI secretion system secreted protein Hcp